MNVKFILFFLLLILFSNHVDCQLKVEGFIVNNEKDTLKATIWKNKKKRLDKKRNYSRITIIDSTGKEVVLSPDQIFAYSKDNSYYRSIRPDNRSSFFVKNITYGKVELYYFRTLEKYLFKKKSEKEFYIIDVELDEDTPFMVGSNEDGSDLIPLKSSEKEFREFFIPYFNSCPLISNKISSQLYKYNDIEVMFKHFNIRCQ